MSVVLDEVLAAWRELAEAELQREFRAALASAKRRAGPAAEADRRKARAELAAGHARLRVAEHAWRVRA